MNFFKKILLVGILFTISAINVAEAYVSVSGYTRKDGTYVAPHVRSNPNGLKYDNYGYKPSQGLYNPSYGTKGAAWDTPTYVTDPNYYAGKALYDSGSSGASIKSPYSTSLPQKQTATPLNAYVYGSSWYCNTGYKTVYNNNYQKTGCEQVIAPANATVYSSDWYCNTGYKTVYNNNYQKIGCSQ